MLKQGNSRGGVFFTVCGKAIVQKSISTSTFGGLSAYFGGLKHISVGSERAGMYF